MDLLDNMLPSDPNFGKFHCRICFTAYDKHRHWECSLACGHVLCIECILKLINQSERTGNLSCPFCRREFQPYGIVFLRTNKNTTEDVLRNFLTVAHREEEE